MRGALGAGTLNALDRSCGNAISGRLKTNGPLGELFGPNSPVSNAIRAVMADAFPTRLVAFAKTANHNWGVPWHQDRIIAVAEKCDHPDYTNWSLKAGTWHCEPPVSVLNEMLFVRLHLDDETPASGSMQIALGSHRSGKIPAAEAAYQASLREVETCIGQRGDILVLNMLTLHCSSAATQAETRRVLRVDYTNRPLPDPFTWNT